MRMSHLSPSSFYTCSLFYCLIILLLLFLHTNDFSHTFRILFYFYTRSVLYPFHIRFVLYPLLFRMTIDGLLVEMSSLLGSRIFISSAEQNHFGNKRLLTSVGLSAPSTSGCSSTGESVGSNVLAELANLRIENQKIKDEIANLRELVEKLQTMNAPSATSAPAPIATEKAADAEDFDLFGSDDEEESEEKKKIVEERLKAYNEKKSKKAGPIAKSSVILDVKPWDDETDLGEMEKRVRSVEMDGLVWGGAKLIAIGYGIKKLQIISVVEDLKVSVDDMIDAITAFEDFVQSVDIVAFNKI